VGGRTFFCSIRIKDEKVLKLLQVTTGDGVMICVYWYRSPTGSSLLLVHVCVACHSLQSLTGVWTLCKLQTYIWPTVIIRRLIYGYYRWLLNYIG